MAVNKNALIRYKILDRCLSNPGKRYFIEDLVSECNKHLLQINPNSKGIQKRQVFEDLKYMESAEGWDAEIKRILAGKKKYYRYADKKFSINNQSLNPAESEQLRSAINIISRFKGMPQFGWVNEFAPKLEQAFTLDANINPIISFDSNDYLKGIEHVSELFQSVLFKKALRITYRSYKSNRFSLFIIHPYYLKQYNNRWFLFGHNHALQKLTNLALDRINLIEEYDLPYRENNEYDFNEYFEDIIGVTKPDGQMVEKVVLKFSDLSLPYVLSKPLHGSQKTIRTENEQLISIEVIHNFELESMLLSFGDNVNVISPQHLQNNINLRLKRAINQYLHSE